MKNSHDENDIVYVILVELLRQRDYLEKIPVAGKNFDHSFLYGQ